MGPELKDHVESSLARKHPCLEDLFFILFAPFVYV
jgi:hypothetical protein